MKKKPAGPFGKLRVEDWRTILLLVFILATLIRFFYFPDNVYFAFDQARDSFTSLEILKGDLKVVGPPSFANDKLSPGPLIFYIYAPIYFLFEKNPEAVSAFLRLYNALGIFLVFIIGSALFNRQIGLLAALIFAVSYEQSQYSLFISHQPLAVITVLIFYLGLAKLIFKNDQKGLVILALGLGLSIQSHYLYVSFIPLAALFSFLFRKRIFPLKKKIIFYSVAAFSATMSTFILAEIKFNFRFLSGLVSQFSGIANSGGRSSLHPESAIFVINRFMHDNFLANYSLTFIPLLIFLLIMMALLFNKDLRPRVIFLAIWLAGGLAPYILSGTTSYYYSAAASVSLLILSSWLIYQIFLKNKIAAVLLLLGILANNLYLVSSFNSKGPNSDIVIQPGMLVRDQKKAIDYIYQKAGSEPFSINGLTIPLNVNTTWSYLFEWYGQQKYSRLPVWGGDAARGFQGNLQVITKRSDLPKRQFLIIEPMVGIRQYDSDNFFRIEGYFTKVIEEQKFGTITVQMREKI